MSELINYIKPELLIVALALYFVGMLLKKIKKLKDNYIPIILGTSGIVACVIYLGVVGGWNIESISCGVVQGLLCAASSTYVNQIIKQMKKLGVNTEAVGIAEIVKGDQKEEGSKDDD